MLFSPLFVIYFCPIMLPQKFWFVFSVERVIWERATPFLGGVAPQHGIRCFGSTCVFQPYPPSCRTAKREHPLHLKNGTDHEIQSPSRGSTFHQRDNGSADPAWASLCSFYCFFPSQRFDHWRYKESDGRQHYRLIIEASRSGVGFIAYVKQQVHIGWSTEYQGEERYGPSE